MRKSGNLFQFVRQSVTEAKSPIELRKIYGKVEANFPLSDSQKERTRYHELRFRQEVRAIIGHLVKKGDLVKVGRGIYRKT